MRPLSWALKRAGAYRWPLGVLATLSSAEVAARVLLPWPMKAVVDEALGTGVPSRWTAWLPGASGGRESLLVAIVVTGLVIQIVHQTILLLHTRKYAQTGHTMTRDLRQELFAHLQALSLRHHAQMPTGEAVYRLESDATCVERLLLRGVLPFAFSAITLVVMFAILARINAALALVALSIVPFLFVWIRWSARLIRPGAERTRRLESRMTARLHESFAAIRLVKSFGREPYEGQRFSGVASAAMAARVGLSGREAVFSSIVGTLIVIGSSLVVLVGGLLVLRGELTVGTLLVALAYLGFVYGPLSGLANTVGGIQEAIVSAGRVRDVLQITPEIHDESDGLPPPRFRGRVEYRGVSFEYGATRVLDDVSFTAEPGTFVAVVGPSGSGKTTLVSLLPRLYEPASGAIVVDGEDIRHFTLGSLREQIAIVLQEAVVMSGSIRDNLRYGRLDATDAEIEAAARAANAHEFIVALPEGYDTELGEAGAGLSGGQRQRLSMARAFLKDAPLLILDEPTASLDTLSEQAVIGAMRRLRAGRTTFVVAHRLSTVMGADQIIVLEHGRIAARGTHDSLMEDSPLYRSLARQFTTGADR